MRRSETLALGGLQHGNLRIAGELWAEPEPWTTAGRLAPPAARYREWRLAGLRKPGGLQAGDPLGVSSYRLSSPRRVYGERWGRVTAQLTSMGESQGVTRTLEVTSVSPGIQKPGLLGQLLAKVYCVCRTGVYMSLSLLGGDSLETRKASQVSKVGPLRGPRS